jgi:hypothetical protein
MVMLKMHDFSLCNILVLGGMMQKAGDGGIHHVT